MKQPMYASAEFDHGVEELSVPDSLAMQCGTGRKVKENFEKRIVFYVLALGFSITRARSRLLSHFEQLKAGLLNKKKRDFSYLCYKVSPLFKKFILPLPFSFSHLPDHIHEKQKHPFSSPPYSHSHTSSLTFLTQPPFIPYLLHS